MTTNKVSLRKDTCPHCDKNHRTLTPDECLDQSMTERTLQDRVVYRLRRDGWKWAHAGRAYVGDETQKTQVVVTPMSPGWPDLTCAKDGHRLIFIELKREHGVISDEQLEWIRLLNRCGAVAVVVRPSDLRLGRVDAITRVGSPLDG